MGYCPTMKLSNAVRPNRSFGDFVVYVDESGDHSLLNVNPQYPLFVLAFCLFKIADYTSLVVPTVQSLKFKYFGHDTVVLHEREISKSLGSFTILRDFKLRSEFMQDLNETVAAAPFKILACVIEKDKLAKRNQKFDSPYRLALEIALGRLSEVLETQGQMGRRTFVIFEGRGPKEDRDLETEFQRLLTVRGGSEMRGFLEPIVVSKKINSSGLQIADMVARPIGLSVLRPNQPNRAFEILEGKLISLPQNLVED